MEAKLAKHVRYRPYWPSLPLMFTLTGWALLSVWLITMGARPLAQVLAAIPALLLTRICTSHLSVEDREMGASDINRRRTPPYGAMLVAALLFGTGAILGTLVVFGSAVLLAAVAIPLSLAPWWRLSLNRHRGSLSFGITSGGFICALATGYQSVDVMFLPLACWIFWSCVACTCLLKIGRSRSIRNYV